MAGMRAVAAVNSTLVNVNAVQRIGDVDRVAVSTLTRIAASCIEAGNQRYNLKSLA